MNSTGSKKLKLLTSKWLFAAVLLLSIFAVSGYTIKLPNHGAVQPSTLVIVSQTSLAKSISYKRGLRSAYHKPFVPEYLIADADISHAYDLALKHRITRLKKAFLPAKRPFLSFQKTIPHSADDEPSYLLG